MARSARNFLVVALVASGIIVGGGIVLLGGSEEIRFEKYSYTPASESLASRIESALIGLVTNKTIEFDPVRNDVTVNYHQYLYPHDIKHSVKVRNENEPGVYRLRTRFAVLGGESHLIVSTSPADSCQSERDVLVLVPDLTWSAYNGLPKEWNGLSLPASLTGKNLYTYQDEKLLLNRPMKLTQAALGAHSPAYNPVQFIQSQFPDLSVDIVAQSKLSDLEYCLNNYKVLIVYGHDEYWTRGLRAKIHAAIYNGTNLLNMSGNTDWGLVELDDKLISRVGYNHELKTDLNHETVLGVSFRWAGYPIERKFDSLTKQDLDKLEATGFPKEHLDGNVLEKTRGLRVVDATHPILRETLLKKGDWFGVESKVVSREFDGFKLDYFGAPVEIEGWSVPLIIAEGYGWRENEFHRAGVVVENKYGKGTVISLASIGWVGSLLSGDEDIELITRNALKYLLNKNQS